MKIISTENYTKSDLKSNQVYTNVINLKNQKNNFIKKSVSTKLPDPRVSNTGIHYDTLSEGLGSDLPRCVCV